MGAGNVDLDAIEAQHRAAAMSHARLTLPLVDDFNIGAALADVPALVAEVRAHRLNSCQSCRDWGKWERHEDHAND